MASVNKVILIGNLGAKPEIKTLPSGKVNCELRVATTDKGKDGERTEWHTVICWDKTAENAAKYLDKGRSVYVEGRIQMRTWDDKQTGQKRYKTEIVASQVVFLGGGKGEKSIAPASGDEFAPPPGGDDDLIPF